MQCREMYHDGRAMLLKTRDQRIGIPNVDLLQDAAPRRQTLQVLDSTAAEIVDRDHALPARNQLLGHIRPEVSGRAGDEPRRPRRWRAELAHACSFPAGWLRSMC